MNRGLIAAGLLLAVLWVVSAESAWAAADEEPKVIFKCVPMKPPRALDALTTEAWVAELRAGPVEELTEAGEKAAQILAAAMKDPRAARWTRHMLTSVKGDRKWTVPVLAAGLDNPDRNERGWSLGASERLGPDTAPAVLAVVAASKSWCADGRLRDAEERNGRDAIELLGQIGPAAREAVDLLVAIFEIRAHHAHTRPGLMPVRGNEDLGSNRAGCHAGCVRYGRQEYGRSTGFFDADQSHLLPPRDAAAGPRTPVCQASSSPPWGRGHRGRACPGQTAAARRQRTSGSVNPCSKTATGDPRSCAGRVGEDAPGSGGCRPETDSLAGRRAQDDPSRRGRRWPRSVLRRCRRCADAARALIPMFVSPRCLASAK